MATKIVRTSIASRPWTPWPALALFAASLLVSPLAQAAEAQASTAAVQASAGAFDKRMAQRTLKQNKCLNCHSVTREKDGPSYQSVSEKYKAHPDPREALFEHLTSSPTITVNGKEESHVSFKTSDTAEIMNVVDWILSN